VLNLLKEILREPAFPGRRVRRGQAADARRAGAGPHRAAGPGRADCCKRKLNPYPKEDVRYTPTIEESLARLETVTVDQVRKLYEEQLGGQAGEFVAVGDFDAAPVLKQMDDALKGWKAKTAYKRNRAADGGGASRASGS